MGRRPVVEEKLELNRKAGSVNENSRPSIKETSPGGKPGSYFNIPHPTICFNVLSGTLHLPIPQSRFYAPQITH